MQSHFGYYPNRFEYTGAKIKIATLPDLDKIKAEVMSWSSVDKDWAYGPPVQQVNLFNPDDVQVLPYPSRIFGLPMTHRIEHPDGDLHRLWYLVWIFGFIAGMRMAPQNPGFIDCAPLKPGTLTDFYGGKRELEIGLECADALWEFAACGR